MTRPALDQELDEGVDHDADTSVRFKPEQDEGLQAPIALHDRRGPGREGASPGSDPLANLPPLKEDLKSGRGGGAPPRRPKRSRRKGDGSPGALRRGAEQIREQISENFDLILIFVALAGAQALVPVGHWLADDGLVPWMMLSFALAAPLRVRALGEGHHPALRPRHLSFERAIRMAVRALLPAAALGLYMGARTLLLPGQLASTPLVKLGVGELGLSVTIEALQLIGAGLGAGFAVLLLTAVSQDEGKTAWNPPGPRGAPFWILGSLALVFISLSTGLYDGLIQAVLKARDEAGELRGWLSMAEWIGPAVLIGAAFIAQGLVMGRSRHLRQRRAAGQRNGEPWRAGWFRYALAGFGPALGLWILMQAIRALQGGSPGFEQAFVGALHVLAWVAVIWPQRSPVAVHCLLHEVRPSSGRDEKGGDTALDFDRVPEGALRINPVDMKPTRSVHPWLVPVRLGRIEDLDDPVKPLWTRPSRPRDHHVLGDASFEPHPVSRQPQTQVITVRLRDPEDVATLSDGDVQSRRIVILRAYPEGSARKGQHRATYRWDTALPPGSIQVVDATTRELELRDGDVLVLSSEGVARAYALEIGTPVYEWGSLATSRPPQIEDYSTL